MHCGKKWWIREFVPPYIFPLNPDYVAARSLRSLRSNKYTPISRKVVGKKCTRQTRKVIWDTISVTSWHCSCRTYFWRTANSKPPTIPFGIVACTFSDNFFRNSCRWAGRLYRLLTPRAVHSLCAWRDYKRQSAQGASLRSEIYEKEPRSTKLWPFVISRFHCTLISNITSRSMCMGR